MAQQPSLSGVAVPADDLPEAVPVSDLRPQGPKPGGITGFAEEATQGINPRAINEGLQQAFWHPVQTATGMLNENARIQHEAHEAFKQGDYVTGLRKYTSWVLNGIPGLGSRLDQSADYMQAGETARGLGAVADIGATMAAPKVVSGAVRTVENPAAAAAWLQEAAEKRFTKVMTPETGPEKLRMGNIAADVAPDVIQQTRARTPGGLLNEVETHLQRGHERLTAGYDQIPAGRNYDTAPILAGIEGKITELQVQGPGHGMSFSPTDVSLTPATRAAQVATLEEVAQQLRELGPRLDITALRKLKTSWDEGARRVYAPATAADYLKTRSEGSGYAAARTVLNDEMIKHHPELAPANADVHLWQRTQDVMSAAEEAERVRPTRGRSLIAGGIGVGVGGGWAGPGGAALGAVIGPTVERVMVNASPVLKMATARRMAAVAEALRSGSQVRLGSTLTALASVLPAAERTALVTQALRAVSHANAEADSQ